MTLVMLPVTSGAHTCIEAKDGRKEAKDGRTRRTVLPNMNPSDTASNEDST